MSPKKRFKILPRLLFFSVAILLVLGGFWLLDGYLRLKKTIRAGEKLYQTVIENRPERFSADFSSWQKNSSAITQKISVIDQLTGGYFERRYKVKKYFGLLQELNSILPKVLAQDSQRIYYVLLQNDRELRPSGGFMGSYAKLKFKNGSLAQLIIQDIYVPDGQIKGHVEPPWPIQSAFKQGWWKLRDANWDPDFSKAVKTIAWFLEKGKEEKADGIMALNLLTIEKVLRITGPLYLVDYHQTLDAGNFYQIIQSQSEIGFFPGSTQKADILSAAGRAFFEKIKKANKKELFQILTILLDDLEHRQILLTFEDKDLAAYFNKLGWDGSLKSLEPSTSQAFNDYFYLVETNLGANKANCCLERKVTQEIDLTNPAKIKEKLLIDFENKGKYEKGIPPFFWGGTYVNFLRVLLPRRVNLTKVAVGGQEVSWGKMLFEDRKDLGLRSVGFFVKVEAGKKEPVEVEYESPKETSVLPAKLTFKLIIQRQPGIVSFPYRLIIKDSQSGEIFFQSERQIAQDEEIIAQIDIMKEKN